jgi:hypothetical protein
MSEMNPSQPKQDPNPETKLFNLVRNWFQLHPDSLISHEAWARKLAAYLPTYQPDNHDLWVVAGSHQINIYKPGMIQVLAAISLDQPLERIATLLEHHGCFVEDLTDCGLLVFPAKDPQPEDTGKFRPLTRYRITERCVQAFSLMPHHAEGLKSVSLTFNPLPDLTSALLTLDDCSFWRRTAIHDYLMDFREGRKLSACQPADMPFNQFRLGLEDGYERTADEILALMYRAGLLLPEASIENGYDRLFFRDMLIRSVDGGTEAVAILNAINQVEDENQRRVIADKLISDLSNRTVPNYDGHGRAILLAFLDQQKYSEVVNSMVLRVNLLEWPVPAIHQTSPFHFVNEQTLFSQIAEELQALPHESFTTHHFRCLHRFARHWDRAHIGAGVDVNKLVAHVMKGYECFTARPKAGGGEMINDDAESNLALFLEFSSKIAKPDYRMLQDIDSDSKRLLCLHGYNIKLFKGMTHQDKGRVLSEELGI